MDSYDVVIVGAGAAGMSAALYAARKKLTTLVISADIGGQTNMTNHIENYPGTDAQPGYDLMEKFKLQAERFGAHFMDGKVSKVDKNGEGFTVSLEDGKQFSARATILAFGKKPRLLGIPGEKEFFGKGVGTCATCDAPLYKNKIVAVIGGGNSAAESALDMLPYATKVYLVHYKDEFKADEITMEKIFKEPKIEVLKSHQSIEVVGSKLIEGLKVKNLKDNSERTLQVNGVFLNIGWIADSKAVEGMVELTPAGEIVIDDRCATKTPGIFAAGDITTVPYKQTVISAGEGAIAALEAHRFLQGTKGAH